MTRRRAWAVAAVAAGVLAVAVYAYFHFRSPPPEEERVALRPVAFGDLAGWTEDDLGAALRPLRRSCEVLLTRPETHVVGIAGTVAVWKPLCRAADAVDERDHAAARRFFEEWFVPHAVSVDGCREGLFTGYYEPELDGSRERGEHYGVPLLRRPADLVDVNLGDFAEDLAGRRIAGRVENGMLAPYFTRAEIMAGALSGRDLEIAWVDDPIDAFFLHIQGSGRVRLADGDTIRVGYAAQNGHPYFAIGRALIGRGVLTPEAMSMQAIRDWLADNPDEADAVMNLNRSYVFFRELAGKGPIGAQGIALTPRRSLAVDAEFVPYSVPVWLETTVPDPDDRARSRAWRRLMIAQDTGGAIRGAVRGDVFWGAGAEAAEIAGRMKSEGRYYLLLPVESLPTTDLGRAVPQN